MSNQYSVEQRTITMDEFYRFYKNKQLVKPPIQRKKRWSIRKQKEFIHFTIELQNIIIPLLMDKTIMNTNELFSVIDGNNRTNSIVSFYKKPLVFFDEFETELIFDGYPEQIVKFIMNMSYYDILEKTSLNEVCNSIVSDDFDAFEWYRCEPRNDRNQTIEQTYKKIHKRIRDTKFDNIRMLLVVFNSMNEEQIVNIYNKVNTTGVRLSSQEIIKSTASLVLYNHNELTYYNEIHRRIKKYIIDSNENEILDVEIPEDTLSVYNVLFGTQLWLYESFPEINELCPTELKNDSNEGNGSTGMDIIFKVYQLIYEDFKQKMTNEINEFIEKFRRFIGIISTVNKKMYGTVITRFNIKLGLNQLFILIILMYSWEKQGKSVNDNIDIIEKILYYNECITFVSSKKDKNKDNNDIKIIKKRFETVSPISFQSGGKFVENLAQKIYKDVNTDTIKPPTRENMRELLQWLTQNSIQETEFKEKRRKQSTNKFEMLLLNRYFYKFVPPYVLEKPLVLDHIIPFATNAWSEPIDINRIGNKMLINDKVNLKKSNKPITDKFLDENNHHYYMYPDENKCSQIIINKVVQKQEYNDLCSQRENTFIETLLELFQN